MRKEANCKINIGLDILNRRADGYHELATVMVPVRGLYDLLEVEPLAGDEVRFSSSGITIDCPAEKNLVVRACRLMQERYGVGGCEVHLDKRVPFGAGLGGGSSDATMMLCALNELYEVGLSHAELERLAAELGSDTPFFVKNCPQYCTGRGEVMTPVELPLEGLWLLLVKPDVAISTREAYAGVHPMLPEVPLLERLALPIEQWQGRVKNDFEQSLFTPYSLLARIKAELLSMGALYASMSGSGSTLFGLFAKEPNPQGRFEGMFWHKEQFRA
uniref:4-(cytidine 5'-diphospho)-2-C-methyl-D-erythritol kinase n=1 Tax=Alistipes sp. TaxID=1872444 RepID=UPI00405743B9